MEESPPIGSIAAPPMQPLSIYNDTLADPVKKGSSLTYRCIRMLGEGTYGIVYEAIHVPSGVHVAIKHLRVSKQHAWLPDISITTIREIVLLRELKHPHIVELVDVLCKNKSLFLVFELCETDLRHIIKQSLVNQKAFSQETPVPNKVIHLVEIQETEMAIGSYAKIADVGLSRLFPDGIHLITNEVVTLWYRAPELLLGDNHYTSALDVWSLGCILVEMCTGRPLFYGFCETDTLFSIFQTFGTPIEPESTTWKETTKDDFSVHAYWKGVDRKPYYKTTFPMWKRDALATLRKIMPYADTAFLDLVIKLLQYNPALRLQAHEILNHPWFTQSS